MSRPRSDRQAATSVGSRSSVDKGQASKSKKEKNDLLRPWKTDKTQLDNDFVRWAKKRETVELHKEKSFASSKIWDAYVCTVIRKCRAIENTEQFIAQSLSSTLKPDVIVAKPTKVVLRHAKSDSLMLKKKSNGHTATNDLLKQGIEHDLSSSIQDIPDAVAQTGALVSDDGVGNTSALHLHLEDDENIASLPESSNRDSVTNRAPAELDKQQDLAGDKPQQVQKATPKFGYTQANRVGLYDGESNRQTSSESSNVTTAQSTVTEFETITELGNGSMVSHKPPVRKYGIVKRTLQATSVSMVPGVDRSNRKPAQRIYHKSRSENNLQDINDIDAASSNARVLTDDISTAAAGMSISSIRTRRTGSSQSEVSHTSQTHSGHLQSQSVTSMTADNDVDSHPQKQVMLVMKKVLLHNGDLAESHVDHVNGVSATSKRNALTSAIARKYGLLQNGYNLDGTIVDKLPRTMSSKTNKSLPSSLSRAGMCDTPPEGPVPVQSARSSYFPIGDLLPAVDSSIRNSMPARHYRQMEHNGLNEQRDVNGATGGRDKSGSFEENGVLTKDSPELLKLLRERETTTAGPQGFRPQHGKTPLQRAKESAHKRLHVQAETNSVQPVDGARSRWESSRGNLYNATSTSRPPSVKRNDDIDLASRERLEHDRLVLPKLRLTSRDPTALHNLSRKFSGAAATTTATAGSTAADNDGRKDDAQPFSGQRLNIENGKLQMQQVSKALATRLHDIARSQAYKESVQDLMQKAGVK